MQSRAHTLRILAMLVLWLGIGAAVNVGVTWGITAVLLPGTWWWGQSTLPPDQWPAPGQAHWPRPEAHSQAKTWYMQGDILSADEYGDGVMTKHVVVTYAFGWPCRAAHMATSSNPRAPTLGVWRLHVPDSRLTRARIVDLPLIPLWTGFAFNTLFYGAIGWTLFGGPFAYRRWRRARSGGCVTCGYDRTGLAHNAICPECGAASQALK